MSRLLLVGFFRSHLTVSLRLFCTRVLSYPVCRSTLLESMARIQEQCSDLVRMCHQAYTPDLLEAAVCHLRFFHKEHTNSFFRVLFVLMFGRIVVWTGTPAGSDHGSVEAALRAADED